jgi:hypothetical protein
MKYLQHTLLSLSLAAFTLGCGTDSNTDPLVPEIVSIEIYDADLNSTIHSIVIDEDQAQLYATVLYDDNSSSTATTQLNWDSNDTAVMNVYNGLLTPAANRGTAAISASFRDKLFTTIDKNVAIMPLSDINITSEQDLNSTGVVTVITTGMTDINISVFNDINKTLRMDVNITAI